MRLEVREIPRAQPATPIGRCPNRTMRNLEQQPLDLPDVAGRQAPVVVAEHAQIDARRTPSGSRSCPCTARSSSAPDARSVRKTGRRPCRPGSRDRATDPQRPRALIDEDHVVEPVDRLEAHHERRISVLFEDHGGGDRGLEAVRRPVADRRRETSAAWPDRAAVPCCRAGRSGNACTARRRAQPANHVAVPLAKMLSVWNLRSVIRAPRPPIAGRRARCWASSRCRSRSCERGRRRR